MREEDAGSYQCLREGEREKVAVDKRRKYLKFQSHEGKKEGEQEETASQPASQSADSQ